MEFINNHFKIFIGLAAIVLAGTFLFIFVYGSQGNIKPIAEVPIVNNVPQYDFMKENISDSDKYIYLTAKIVAEEYGTYSTSDIRGLEDVANQSTAAFASVVQEKINTILKASSDDFYATTVDGDTIVLSKDKEKIIATMQGITADRSNNLQPVEIIVTFAAGNKNPLVNGIVFKNK